MLLEAFLIWNSVMSSFQCEIMGYQNSSECRGYSDRSKMVSKFMISGDQVSLRKKSSM